MTQEHSENAELREDPVVTAPTEAPLEPVPTEGPAIEADATTAALYEPFVVPLQNVQDDPPNEPLTSPALGKANDPVIAMPSAPDAAIEYAQQRLPKNFKASEDWLTVQSLSETQDSDGEFEQALNDPEAKWERKVMHGERRLGAQNLSTPSIAGREVEGTQAVQSWRSHSRGSAGASVLFWGSGFSARFDAIPNKDLYDLSREISASRITVGRSSYGMALSQHMTYTAEAILMHAKKAMSKSSLAPGIDLGDVLRVTDFQSLVWAMALATWPHGFDIERGCIAQPDTCQAIIKERVALRRMQIVDRNKISDEQRQFMLLLQDDKSTREDLARYQTLFPKARTAEYPIDFDNGSQAMLHLTVPTLNEYIAAGKQFIDDVNRATVTAIGETASFGERNTQMQERMSLAAGRQYSHWVQKIDLGGGVISSTATIIEIVGNEISADDRQLEQFIKSVRDFHEKVTTSVIALNNFKCPSCHRHQVVVKGHEGQEDQPKTYIPVEVISTFFGLMYQKLEMAPA